jgi:nuclear transport factor 2 (NTF2) superfamily protein
MNQTAKPASGQPIKPPFTEETARAKVQAAEDAWNTRDPERVALAYTEDSVWRNRDEFLSGRDAIRAFLRRKWKKEINYRLKKEMWAYGDRRIAVRFEYEWQNDSGQWFRSYGNELWEFDDEGLMRTRQASINDTKISADERRIAV